MLYDDRGLRNRKDYVDPKEMIRLEEELHTLKEEHGIQEQTWWMKIGDVLAERMDRDKVPVDRKKYIRLAMGLGWLCGAHRFYTHQKSLGILYLLFFWTGIPFAMTMVDLMIALPMRADEQGMIQL